MCLGETGACSRRGNVRESRFCSYIVSSFPDIEYCVIELSLSCPDESGGTAMAVECLWLRGRVTDWVSSLGPLKLPRPRP